MRDVPVEIVQVAHIAVIAQENAIVIEPDEAAAPHHLFDLCVRQVALVRADRAGVGVRGDERPFRRFEHVRKPRIIEVRNVDEYPAALHLAHGIAAEGRQPPVGHIARAELIFPVPRKRHGADALTLQFSDARQVPRERAAVLHAQKGRRLPRRPRALHVGYRAAGRHPIRKVLHLALKIFTRRVEKADCLLPAQAVRQENGEKLRPVHILWEV